MGILEQARKSKGVSSNGASPKGSILSKARAGYGISTASLASGIEDFKRRQEEAKVKEKQRQREEAIRRSQEEAKRYFEEQQKYDGRASTLEGIAKSVVRPFVSLADVPRNILSGGRSVSEPVNVPGVGPVESYQREAQRVSGQIVEGEKPVTSILKPIGSAVLDTAGLGIGSSAASAVGKGATRAMLKGLAKEGAVYGAGQAGVETIDTGISPMERAKSIGAGAVLGAGLTAGAGLGFSLIGKGISKLIGKPVREVSEAENRKVVQEVAAVTGEQPTQYEAQLIREANNSGASKDEIVQAVRTEKVNTIEKAQQPVEPVQRAETPKPETPAMAQKLTQETTIPEMRTSTVPQQKATLEAPKEKPITSKIGDKKEKSLIKEVKTKQKQLDDLKRFVKQEARAEHGFNTTDFFDSQLNAQYDSFSKMVNKSSKMKDIVSSGDFESIMNAVRGTDKEKTVKNMFWSDTKSENEVFNDFVKAYNKEKSLPKISEFVDKKLKDFENTQDYAIATKEIKAAEAKLLEHQNMKIDEVNKGIKEIQEPVGDIKTAKVVSKESLKETADRKKSVIAKRLNEALPNEAKINEFYDVKHIREESAKAAEKIRKNKESALREAFSTEAPAADRNMILGELGEIARRDGDMETLNALLTKRRQNITESAQALALEKAFVVARPEERFMQDVINARLGKVRIGKFDLAKATEKVQKFVREKSESIRKETKRTINIRKAQEIFDSLICK